MYTSCLCRELSPVGVRLLNRRRRHALQLRWWRWRAGRGACAGSGSTPIRRPNRRRWRKKRAGCEAKEIEIASRGADSQSAAPALVPAPPKAHGTRGRGAYPRARRGACKNNRIRKVAMPWKSRCRIFLARENRRAVFGRFREANIARSLTVWADCRRNSFAREFRPRYIAPVMARKGHRR